MKTAQTGADHKINVVDKLQALDFMIDSLSKLHKDDIVQQEEMLKKISTRKLILMEELYRLISPLKVI